VEEGNDRITPSDGDGVFVAGPGPAVGLDTAGIPD
jgi:hypothetical protein